MKPKFEYNDIVSFEVRMSKDVKPITLEGTIAIIDAYGTFEQNEEVSYDIYVPSMNTLFKHFRESRLTFIRKGNKEERFNTCMNG